MRKRNIPLLILLLLLLFVILSTCNGEKTDSSKWDSDGPFNALKAELINKAIDTVIISQNGEIVWDYYAKGWNPDRLHVIHSCTKSIVSLLIGTLLDRGLIENTEVPVYTLFPKLDSSSLKEENKALKLKDFLTMSTGLRSRDSY